MKPFHLISKFDSYTICKTTKEHVTKESHKLQLFTTNLVGMYTLSVIVSRSFDLGQTSINRNCLFYCEIQKNLSIETIPVMSIVIEKKNNQIPNG